MRRKGQQVIHRIKQKVMGIPTAIWLVQLSNRFVFAQLSNELSLWDFTFFLRTFAIRSQNTRIGFTKDACIIFTNKFVSESLWLDISGRSPYLKHIVTHGAIFRPKFGADSDSVDSDISVLFFKCQHGVPRRHCTSHNSSSTNSYVPQKALQIACISSVSQPTPNRFWGWLHHFSRQVILPL